MIYTPRYIFNSDLEKTLCSCSNVKKYRVLFSYSSSIEDAVNGNLIELYGQIIAVCSRCGKIYKFDVKYIPSSCDKSEVRNIEEISKDISQVREDIKCKYQSYEESFSFKSEEFLIKVINEKCYLDKKVTDFIYIEK